MQRDVDAYLEGYNRRRPHEGSGMNNRTPYEVFVEGLFPGRDPERGL
jgi:hypothetical protein